jgi:hypothetical protein
MRLRGSRSLILSAAIILLSQLSIIQPAYSQTGKSMTVGGVELTLGMKKEEVLNKLADFKLNEGAHDSWDIGRKNLVSGYFETVGSIQFEKGKLISAQRDWGTTQNENASELFGYLFSALSGVTSEQGTIAVVQTYRREQPEMSVRFVEIHAGGRTITISIAKTPGTASEQVAVSEYIRQE